MHSELGKTANFTRYSRKNRTPMTFVLDEVEHQMGPLFSVYWVNDGPPEVFTLPGFSPSPVIFSTRYLSLSAFVRHLLVGDSLKDVLIDVAERTMLKVMAEMALRNGDPDYAVLAFAKSMPEKDIYLNDSDQMMEFESAPIREAYMATWFYGLLHELGHLHPNQTEHFPVGHSFSDDGILSAITVALDSFAAYPGSLKQQAMERAKQWRSASLLGIDHIRKEGLADVFAASILFQSTLDIMQELKQRDSNQPQFRVEQFVSEMFIFLNIITMIDRCRRVALVASATNSDEGVRFESLALQPVSVLVRALMLRQYLESAVTRYLFDTEEPTLQQFQQVQKLIDQINEHFADKINAVDSGVAQAMQFSLFPERRENDWVLLEALRKDLSNSNFGLLETKRFCQMADGLGKDSKLLQALQGIAEDASQPLRPDPKGDL